MMYQYRVRDNGFYFMFEYSDNDWKTYQTLMTTPMPKDPNAQATVICAFINWVAQR